MTHVPITDLNLPFSEYIKRCQHLIRERRQDLNRAEGNPDTIIHANSPFEGLAHKPKRIGVLMIHGLLDCPFTFREITSPLNAQGIATKAVLLPGHGTRPSDLLTVTYHDWLQTVRYGILAFKDEVDELYLMGYSTGAALAIYHALFEPIVKGVMVIAPAIKLRAPVDLGASFYHFTNQLGKDHAWVFHCEENDYAKYRSITFNAVQQVVKLTSAVRDLCGEHQVKQPIHMVLSREDETISSRKAIDFFSSMHHPQSKLLLYSGSPQSYPDARIQTVISQNLAIHVEHYAHAALGFSADNNHYGEQGDYCEASHLLNGEYIYGAYNKIEITAFDVMKKYNLVKHARRVLTYHPEFNHMMEDILAFIWRVSK